MEGLPPEIAGAPPSLYALRPSLPAGEPCPADVWPIHLPDLSLLKSPRNPLPGFALLASVTHVFPRAYFIFVRVAGAAFLCLCFWYLLLDTCGRLHRHLSKSRAPMLSAGALWGQKGRGAAGLASARPGGGSVSARWSGLGARLELCLQAHGTAAPLRLPSAPSSPISAFPWFQ